MKKLLFIILVLVAYSGHAQPTILYKSDSVLITTTRMTYGNVIPFVVDTTDKTGYTDFTSLENIANYGGYCGDFKWVRNVLIIDYLPGWDSLTISQQQIFVGYNVMPDSTLTAELDSIYSLPKRNKYRDHCMEELKDCDCLILHAPGSEKYFHRKSDTTGVVSSKEITTHQIVD